MSEISRPGWDEYFMLLAILTASRASCRHVRAGSVIVKNKRVLGTGYNGAPPGVPNCLEMGCRKENLGLSYHSSLNSGTCIGVHSEVNALGHLSGISQREFTLYTTIFPCHSCAKNLLAYGVSRIVYLREYSDEEFKRTVKLFEKANVKVEKINIDEERVKEILFNLPEVDFDVFPKK